MKLDDIVAYTYRADLVCPACVLETVGIEESRGTVEESLRDAAPWHGVNDLENEASYDSDNFPKVVFRDQVRGPLESYDTGESADYCGVCYALLRWVESTDRFSLG